MSKFECLPMYSCCSEVIWDYRPYLFGPWSESDRHSQTIWKLEKFILLLSVLCSQWFSHSPHLFIKLKYISKCVGKLCSCYFCINLDPCLDPQPPHPSPCIFRFARWRRMPVNLCDWFLLKRCGALHLPESPRGSICVCCCVTMPLVSAWTGPSLWSVVELRLLSHFLWLQYFILHNHKHTQPWEQPWSSTLYQLKREREAVHGRQ